MSRRDELALRDYLEHIQRHFPDFTTKHPNFPLKAAYGTRNALARGYFKVDLDMVWRTVERDLPELEVQVEEAILSLNYTGTSPSP